MALLYPYTHISTSGETLIAVIASILSAAVIWLACMFYDYKKKRFPKDKDTVAVIRTESELYQAEKSELQHIPVKPVYADEMPAAPATPDFAKVCYMCTGSWPPENTLVLIEVMRHLETPEEDTTITYTTCGMYQGNGTWSILEMTNPEENGKQKYRWSPWLKECSLDWGLLMIKKWEPLPGPKDNPE